jgi:LmbE family N-acetylglucosaminyl deacetylase
MQDMVQPTKRVLNIVAHEDDDLLFLNPDLLHVIQASHNVRTIYLTAGDTGVGVNYRRKREVGVLAAYAQMCGVANSWTETDAYISGHPIPVFTLSDHPSVSLAFMRLPDGNFDGTGFASTGRVSLQRLWTGAISTIEVLDGSSSYTKATLISTFASLISSFQPDQVNMQDYVGTYGDGDHSDHHSVAYFVQSALQHYSAPHSFTGYEGYNSCFRPANVTGADLVAKRDAFYIYTQHDHLVWGVPQIMTKFGIVSVGFCRFVSLLRLRKYADSLVIGKRTISNNEGSYIAWLQRQYTVGLGFGGGKSQLVATSGRVDNRQRNSVPNCQLQMAGDFCLG